MNKIENSEDKKLLLKTLQGFSLEEKIEMTAQKLEDFVGYYGLKNVYISFSGGKDSTVLLHIARQMYPSIKAIFSNTGLEYPQIIRFVKEFENVDIVRAKVSYKDVIGSRGYPIISKEVAESLHYHKVWERKGKGRKTAKVRQLYGEGEYENSRFNKKKYKILTGANFNVSHMCCSDLKKKPIHKIKLHRIVGTLACESDRRRAVWLKYGCNIYTEGRLGSSTPISFWQEQDILEYIHLNKLQLAEVYGEVEKDNKGKFYTTGVERTGCVACGFGCHMDKGRRFEHLKKYAPKLYDYTMTGGEYVNEVWVANNKGLGMAHVFDWCNENINNFKIIY